MPNKISSEFKNIILIEVCIIFLLYPFSLLYQNFPPISLLFSFYSIVINIILILINYLRKEKYTFSFILPVIAVIISIITYFFEAGLFEKADLRVPVTMVNIIISAFLFLQIVLFNSVSFLSFLKSYKK